MPGKIGEKLFEHGQPCNIVATDQLALTGYIACAVGNYVVVCIAPHDMRLKVRYETIAFVVCFGNRLEIVLKD